VATVSRYSRDEIAQRGDKTYERVMPHLSPEDECKCALIDLETGDFEVVRDELAASDRLCARHPDVGRQAVAPSAPAPLFVPMAVEYKHGPELR
jgi:hypothetical protein